MMMQRTANEYAACERKLEDFLIESGSEFQAMAALSKSQPANF